MRLQSTVTTDVYRDAAARAEPGDWGRDELAPPPESLDGAVRDAFFAEPAWRTMPEETWLATEIVPVRAGARFLDVTVVLDLPWDQTRDYEHSKLYFAVEEPFEFSEECVVCFRFRWLRRIQTMRLVLPEVVRHAGRARFRLDPFPYCSAGRMAVHSIRFSGGDAQDEISRVAELYALKEETRQRVEDSERVGVAECDHLPSSLSVELTARCNLTCGHCSSHGEKDLHRRYNRMPEMTVEHLDRLAEEVFPALTAFGLVGRGEPLATTRKLWEALVGHVRHQRVFLTMVTNGTMLDRRITPDLLPLIETLTVSVDGATQSTFAAHRGGAVLDNVLEQVGHFHDLRRRSGLTRRPRLGFSWTLMRDNVAEFPVFLRRVLELEPDLVYARHLLVFFEKMREQSLLGHAGEANGPLAEAYALMSEHGIRSDCPPLMAEGPAQPAEPAAPHRDDGPRQERCMFVHRTGVIAVDGEVPTCSAPFAAIAGRLDETPSYLDIWNGPTFRSVRAGLGTTEEWDQCRKCWYREGRYDVQRTHADLRQPRYDLQRKEQFDLRAWDFREYEQ
jgi:MoaA/NifB/PqqE/SkfB family radical SAM enzyme